MSVEEETARRFAERFTGSTRVYGWYDARNMRTAENGKSTGKAYTRKVPPDPELTEDLYVQHLRGEAGLGIMPIRDDDTCMWGCIDVDEYGPEFNPSKVAKSIYADAARLGLPLVVTRSKSGGLHLWVFFNAPVYAGVLMKKLIDVAGFLGFPGVEVFPKQSTVKNPQKPTELRIGNWINVPYFNYDTTTRYAYGILGDQLSLEEFLDYADTRLVDPSKFQELDLASAADMPFSDGPPCLQKLARQGIPEGGRNNVVYQAAIYYKKKCPERIIDSYNVSIVDLFNQEYVHPPLGPQEVHTIKHSVAEKDYHYKCSDIPMRDYCNRSECIRRQYGVSDGGGGGAAGVQLVFEELTKYMYLDREGNPTDNPAYWEMTINDVVFRFEDEELMTFLAVKKRLFASLDILSADIAKPVWEDHLRGLLEKVNRVILPYEESYEGRLFLLLQDFISENKNVATVFEDIKRGLVFYDDIDDEYIFQLQHFHKFTVECGLKGSSTKIRAVLKRDHDIITRNVNRGNFNSTAMFVPKEKVDLDDRHQKPIIDKDVPF